ncbi:hypothetical protein Taro_027496 [Colocasia esculenta]|uniref:Hydroxyproline-rich glycoprotein family protein n=1 Tax=Colocasia esculenta TaxID=4460 RepID=A0A843VMN0_COLES|nr:hypothetical protein [Colocasia esculenta]
MRLPSLSLSVCPNGVASFAASSPDEARFPNRVSTGEILGLWRKNFAAGPLFGDLGAAICKLDVVDRGNLEFHRWGGVMRGVNNSVETVNAAATAIVAAESRVQQVTSPRRRWGGCFSIYWCFGYQKHDKRVGHAAFVPEPTLPGAGPLPLENSTLPPPPVLPFVAPPSSPASFFQSEPTSATLSPAGPLSLTALSANAYSPGGPASIFAIGPYANETQLVSPPVFSTFTTEPSTAPFTPPPEPVHLTTPSSPEVPFAKLLTSEHRKGETYEFQTYQLYPGSPISHLISPSSVCSGTSSPFPDREFQSSVGSYLPALPRGEPPKILTAEELTFQNLGARRSSRNCDLLLDGQNAASVSDSDNRYRNGDTVVEHRVSFEITVEEVARCLAKESTFSGRVASSSPEIGQNSDAIPSSEVGRVGETYHELPEKLQHSTSLGTAKEFKFDNADGTSAETNVGPDWWANEKVTGSESGHRKNWVFFPLIPSGVS